MKSGVLVLAILILITIPLISCVDFQMKSNFSQGETLIAKISGNFIQKPIQQNIFLYRNKVRAALDYYLFQIDNDFYLYAQLLGKTPANYSIVITNVKYYAELQKISEEDLVKNFTITDNIASFSIAPGFVETKDNFSLEIKNLLDKEINVLVDLGENEIKYIKENSSSNSTGFWASLFGGGSSNQNNLKAVEVPKTREFIFSPTQVKTIDLSLAQVSETKIQTIILSSGETIYNLPVHLLKSEIKQPENITPIPQGELYFNPSLLNISISTSDSPRTFQIHLINTGSKLENISIYLDTLFSDFFSVSPDNIKTLNKDQEIDLNLSTTSFNYSSVLGNSFSRTLNGNLFAKSKNESASMEINLNIFKSYIQNNTVLSCLELNGKICARNMTCSGQIKLAKDGNCCLGNCIIPETPKISMALLGWTLVILVLVFLVWFFKFRYKGVKSDPNLNKYFEKK